MLGLTQQEWERLKLLQHEYNLRHSKIIEKMEKDLKEKEYAKNTNRR